MNTEEAARRVGASCAQVDRWVRTGIISPSGRTTTFYGSYAWSWTSRDLLRLQTVAQIMSLGEGGERQAGCGDTAQLVMKHWRKGPAWLVISPATTKGVMVTAIEKVPTAVRRVGGRALVVPLP